MDKKNLAGQVLNAAKKGIESIDTDDIKKKAAETGAAISDKASDLKDASIDIKNDISDKVNELDNMLKQAITDYNDAYTLMSDKGMKLFVERNLTVDTIDFAESLVNSIANHPKEFDDEFEEMNESRKAFIGTCDFADKEVNNARKAAANAGAGLAAGAAVAMMAPTGAMWIATTFGTASTGAAINTLAGAAAEKAALAWLGGGALSAGGGGIAAGDALLALAGPVGWGIAGASLLASIVLFSRNKMKLNKEKDEEIEKVKKNTEKVKEMDSEINVLLKKTHDLRIKTNAFYQDCMPLYDGDYQSFSRGDKQRMMNLVNNLRNLSSLIDETVTQEDESAESTDGEW